MKKSMLKGDGLFMGIPSVHIPLKREILFVPNDQIKRSSQQIESHITSPTEKNREASIRRHRNGDRVNVFFE
jgi:hypothetical protein